VLKLLVGTGARVLQDTRFVLGFSLKISKNILRRSEKREPNQSFGSLLSKLGQKSFEALMSPEKF
jgi:hypothetical protein